jgi:hypothetical protein
MKRAFDMAKLPLGKKGSKDKKRAWIDAPSP